MRQFRDRMVRLKRNIQKTGFAKEASRLERRVTSIEQLQQVNTFGNRELIGYPIQENERDLILLTNAPADTSSLYLLAKYQEARPESVAALKSHLSTFSSLVQVHVLRPHRPPFLLCDELFVWGSKKRRCGKLGAYKPRTSSRQATSVRFPMELHDLIREESSSLSDTVVHIVAEHYRRLRKYD